MAEPRNDINDVEDELPIGYVGAAMMPGPIMSLPEDHEPPKFVRKRDASKGDQTKTGTCSETEREATHGKANEYEKPSYIQGAKDAVVGSLKQTAVGKATGNKETIDKGKEQKEHGNEEIKKSKQENNYDDKFEILGGINDM